MYRFRVVLRFLVYSAICSTCMDMHRNMLWVASWQHRHWGNLIAFRCFSTHQLQVTGECRWSTVIACGHSCSASLHQLSLRSCWMCNCLTRRCEDLERSMLRNVDKPFGPCFPEPRDGRRMQHWLGCWVSFSPAGVPLHSVKVKEQIDADVPRTRRLAHLAHLAHLAQRYLKHFPILWISRCWGVPCCNT